MEKNLSAQLQEEKKFHSYNYESGNPALFVGTYAKYNDGNALGGMWVDMTTFSDEEEFFDFCRLLHHDETDPEFGFWDYENMPYELYNESLCPDEIAEIIEFANESDEHREVMEAYVDNYGWYKQLSWKEVEERYQGKWDSEEEFAEHLFDELYSYEISDFARRYFDMDAFARDLFAGDYVFVDGHVFSER